MEITGAQSRAARGLLNWSAAFLAEKAQVSLRSIQRLESDVAAPLLPAILAALRAALESAGVEFIPENGGGAGVRLRKEKPGPIAAGVRNVE